MSKQKLPFDPNSPWLPGWRRMQRWHFRQLWLARVIATMAVLLLTSLLIWGLTRQPANADHADHAIRGCSEQSQMEQVTNNAAPDPPLVFELSPKKLEEADVRWMLGATGYDIDGGILNDPEYIRYMEEEFGNNE